MSDAGMIAQFQSVAGCDPETAGRYIAQAGGDLEAAVNTFLAGGGAPASPAAAAAMGGEGATPPAVAAAAAPAPPPYQYKPTSNVVGFGSSTADPDAEGRQEYYAGGASSGAAILDPAKKEKDIFKRLQAQAAAQGPYDGASAAPPGAAAPAGAAAAGHSWGSGASLGGDGKDSQQFGASPGGAAAAAAAAAAAPGQVSQIVITRYSDGFTVDMGDGEGEGPVRRPDQPGNAMFLQALEQGKVPMELQQLARARGGGVALDVALADKRGEPAPTPKFKAFAGSEGHALGGGAAAEEAKAKLAAAAAAAPTSGGSSWGGANEALPTTKVQIRLHDGTRVVQTFNHTQTVGDIRAFLNASQAGMGAITYSLATTFPRKVLADDGATLQAEGLINGVIVQSLS